MSRFALACCLLPAIALADDLPAPVKAIEKQGITIIKSFDAPGGMKGYLGKYQDMGVTIYLTPDGKQAISGYMYDGKGTNLSEQMIQQELYGPQGRALWQQMEKSTWLLDGKKDAPRVVYVFADPFCPYCRQFWKMARPWVESGKVQLRSVLLGVIKPESPAAAAANLASDDMAKAWHEYEQSGGKNAPKAPASVAPAQMKVLNDNEKLMDALGASATPALYYLNDQQMLQQVAGLPDAENLQAMMGDK